MRNDELFSPGCPDDHARRLVLNYALRGVLDDRGCYSEARLLAAQHRVYEEWLAAVHEVFALACGRAKDCPMLKGGCDGE